MEKYRMKKVFPLMPGVMTAVLLSTLLLAGCVRKERTPRTLIGELDTPGKKYATVNPDGLQIQLISKPVVYAGKSASLIFSLRNRSHRRINIREWLSNEPENMVIYVQPFLTGMKAPDPDRWTKLEVPRKRPVIHYPLILMPENQVLVTKNLNFIAKLYVPPRSERRFFMRAESTLQSLKLASDVIVLHVLPNQVVRD